MDVKKIYLDWLDREIIQTKMAGETVELLFPFLEAIEGKKEHQVFVSIPRVYVRNKSDGYEVFTKFYGQGIDDISYSCTDEIDIPCCIQGIINSVLRGAIK